MFRVDEVSGAIEEGTAVIPGSLASIGTMGYVDAYVDADLSQRLPWSFTDRDGVLLIIANIECPIVDTTYRPTLVLSSSGRVGWVIDFRLHHLAGDR